MNVFSQLARYYNAIHYYTGHHPSIGLFFLDEYEQAIGQAGFDIVELYRGKDIQMGMAYVCRK